MSDMDILADGTCCGEGISDIRITRSGKIMCMCCAAEETVPIMWEYPDPVPLMIVLGVLSWGTIKVNYPEPPFTPRDMMQRIRKAARRERGTTLPLR